VIAVADLVGVTDEPAHIPGLGPIPADLARALAADATWRAWITDASGAVAATGTQGYVPTAAISRLVRAREPHCRMPGCRQPAPACDLDHTTAHPHGPTTTSNLGPLCRRHHILKTHAGWDLEPDAGQPPPTPHLTGSDPPDPVAWTWRTPAGFHIHDHADPPLSLHT